MDPSDTHLLKLRAQDFVTSLVLILVSVFFLWQTSLLPFFNTSVAGVDSAKWYNSAAIVPYGIFGALLFMSVGLMVRSITDGGLKFLIDASGLHIDRQEALRLAAISIILLSYIFALVPRVDFIICSAVLITALIWGFHQSTRPRMIGSALSVMFAGLYALVSNFPQSDWQKNHDDDWVTLAVWVGLTVWMHISTRTSSTAPAVVKVTPWLSIFAPLILVISMAFGFRQNVPNRGGLLFSQIEYTYYVKIRPLWQGTN